ncbi:hypothetical protein [Amycolatopsis sp. NPDC003731]
MEYGLSHIRSLIMTKWSPAQVLDAGNSQAALKDLWQELILVEHVGAWRSMTALCGQILEANIRAALLQSRPDLAAFSRKSTFEKVIEKSIDSGLFDAPAVFTVAGALTNARQIRNVASHFSPFDRHGPNEARATQLLATLVTFSDWLAYPDDRQHQHDPQPRSLQAVRQAVSQAMNGRPLPEETTWAAALGELFGTMSPRSCTKFLGTATKSRHVPREALADAIHENFHQLLRRLGRSHVKDVLELIGRLRILDMKPHMQVIGAILPVSAITTELLRLDEQQQFRMNFHSAARLMRASRISDPELHQKVFNSNDSKESLLSALHTRITKDEFQSQNLADFIRQLPRSAFFHLWTSDRFLDALTRALATRSANDYFAFIALLRRPVTSSNTKAARAYVQLCGKLLDRCHDDDLYTVGVAVSKGLEVAAEHESVLSQSVDVLVSRIRGLHQQSLDSAVALWTIARYRHQACARIPPVIREIDQACLIHRDANVIFWSTLSLTSGQDGWVPPKPRKLDVAPVLDRIADPETSRWTRLLLAHGLSLQHLLPAAVRREMYDVAASVTPQDDASHRLVAFFLGAATAADPAELVRRSV